MKYTIQWAGFAALLMLLAGNIANAYNYPFKDPYVATILATPPKYAFQPETEVPIKNATLRMFPDRKVPEIFWYLGDLQYSYLQQKAAAPLIFLIAGTGASYKSPKMLAMQKAFYLAGYHVVSVSSPTHPNFIVAASTSQVPGHLVEDSRDIYNVMEAIWTKLQKKNMVATEFNLAGYSLGGTQAAYVAKLDEERQVFNFRKVLLINPAVSLYNSVVRLDAMLEDHLPGGLDNFDTYYKNAVSAFSDAYKNDTRIGFNDDFLYDVYKYRMPRSDENLEVMIGFSFRLASRDMAFTTDVLTHAGYVVPKGLQLDRFKDRSIYHKVLSRLSFVDYFDGVFLPHFQTDNPTLTAEELIAEMSLANIESYLRSATKIGVVTNADDIILDATEVDYLRDVFGNRARVLPTGGHCGNMNYPENVYAMLNFFVAPSMPAPPSHSVVDTGNRG